MSAPEASTFTSPPPERSLNNQLVLEEDEYTEALSKIIARDFFPSLIHLDATNEYLDAVQSKDPQLIMASVRRIQDLSDTPVVPRRGYGPSQTPFGMGAGATPLQTPRYEMEEPPTKRARYDTDMSLDNFQARYTSEDNSSFTQIMDDENRLRREKWGWAWDAQRRVEAAKQKSVEQRERLLLEPVSAVGVRETLRIEAPVDPRGLITDGSEQNGEDDKAGKELILQDDSEQAVDVMAPLKDTRTTVVDGWSFKARNSLMFSPDADESPYHVNPNKLPPANGPPKVIVHAGTRMAEDEHEHSNASRASSRPPSPTRSHINAAITGTPYHPRSQDGSFSLVPNVPSPTPSELGPAAVQQLMTWGTLNATPRIISSDDPAITLGASAGPNVFKINDLSAREKLSNRLSNKASKSIRAKAEMMSGRPSTTVTSTPITKTPMSRRGGTMGPPSATPRRSEAAGALTPAAKRLLERTTMGARRAEAMERTSSWAGKGVKAEQDLSRVRWTPTPSGSGTRR